MTEETTSRPQRPWLRWLAIAVLIVLFFVLYPQLMDFGGEIYRLFS